MRLRDGEHDEDAPHRAHPRCGIGVEVAASARAVLAAIDSRYDLSLLIQEFDWSCQRYHDTGALMPPDGLDTLRRYNDHPVRRRRMPNAPDHAYLGAAHPDPPRIQRVCICVRFARSQG